MFDKIKLSLYHLGYMRDKGDEESSQVVSRPIRLAYYNTLIDNYKIWQRRRFVDLDIITILNDMNYTLTNAGEQQLLHHFLTSQTLNKQSINQEEQQLLQQIGYQQHLTMYSFFDNDYKYMLPSSRKIVYSLGLLPLWVIIGCFFKLAFLMLFFQLMINYIISIYYEERLDFIREHLNYLLSITYKINKTAIHPDISDPSLILIEQLKNKKRLFIEGENQSQYLLVSIVWLRKLFICNLLEVIKYYGIFIKHRQQFKEIYNYIGSLDLAQLKEVCLQELDIVETHENEHFHLVDMCHPLIENFKSYTLDFEKSMLITGTNASGKSIFLKTLSINLLFSKILGVAFATEFHAPKLNLITSIDIIDNLFENESLFVTELQIIKQVLAKTNCLAVIDEPFRGTTASESAALVYALLKTFHQNNRYYFISTHHKSLALEEYQSRCYYFDETQEKYKLYRGINDSSNAITLATTMIDDQQFITLANEYLSK